MSPAEELELLRLRKRKALAAQDTKPAHVFTGAPERAAEAQKLAESGGGYGADLAKALGLTPGGMGAQAIGAVDRGVSGIGGGMYGTHQNISDLLGNLPGNEGARVSPQAFRDTEQAMAPLRNDFAGNLGNLTGQTAMLAPVAAAAGAAALPLVPQALSAAAPSLALGAGNAAQNAITAGPGKRGEGALSGLEFGLGLGAAGNTLGALLRPIAGKAKDLIGSVVRGGYVQPTPEAARLAGQGAKLTLGQMNPNSLFGQTEELAANMVTGGPLSAARDQGASGLRDVLIRAAGAKGAKPPTAGAPVAQQLEELKAGFGQLYNDALEGAPLTPESYLGKGKWRGLVTDDSLQGSAKMKGAFDLAANSREIDASPAVRRRALSWLTDKAQTLTPTKSGPNAGTVDAKSIHALRTQLRDKIRNLGGEGDDRQLGEIYGRAEQFVTELLEGQLPPERAAMLKSADSAYRNMMSVQDAAKRAFVQNEEFIPAQLLQSIRSKGATPEFEALTRDAHAVAAPHYTPTGLQGAAVASVPGYKWLGPAWANLANSSPTLRAHALREATRQLGPVLQAQPGASLGDLLLSPSAQPSLTRLLPNFGFQPSEAR